MWALDVEPSDPAVVSPNTIVTVNLSSSTTYQYSSRSSNFANLPFSPANISVGQEVVVHGQVTPPKGIVLRHPSPPSTLRTRFM